MALKLQILLEAVDRLTAPLARVQARLGALARAGGADRLAGAMGRVAAGARQAAGAILDMVRPLAVATAAAGGLAVIMAGRSALAGAAAMERYRITLTQVEGSAAAAERALSWVDDFAARTPFSLDEVTRAFVDIRNLGIDPTRGALAAAGDAAAIMGTRFDEAVTALSAALRGEMDPIERFGIFARTEGENIVMEWEANGRRMRAVVEKTNRAMLATMIQTAWSQKFGGGARDLSRAWDGMMSNLADAWARFQLRIMNAGVFDWLRDRLERLLAAIDRAAADGRLQRWADAIAASVIRVLEAVEKLVIEGDLLGRLGAAAQRAGDAFAWLQRTLEPVIGPFDALDAALVSIAAVFTAPFFAGLAALGGGLAALAAVLVGTKFGLALLALTALAALGRTLRQNWDGVLDWFGRQWDGVTAAFNRAIAAGERLLNLIPRLSPGQSVTPNDVAPPGSPERQRRSRGRWVPEGPSLDDLPGLMDGGASPMSFGGAGRVDTGGVLRIRIEDGRVATTGRMNDPRTRLDVDQGLLMGSA
jgi:hypothetical protein